LIPVPAAIEKPSLGRVCEGTALEDGPEDGSWFGSFVFSA
jgi:hypothetical protein